MGLRISREKGGNVRISPFGFDGSDGWREFAGMIDDCVAYRMSGGWLVADKGSDFGLYGVSRCPEYIGRLVGERYPGLDVGDRDAVVDAYTDVLADEIDDLLDCMDMLAGESVSEDEEGLPGSDFDVDKNRCEEGKKCGCREIGKGCESVREAVGSCSEDDRKEDSNGYVGRIPSQSGYETGMRKTRRRGKDGRFAKEEKGCVCDAYLEVIGRDGRRVGFNEYISERLREDGVELGENDYRRLVSQKSSFEYCLRLNNEVGEKRTLEYTFEVVNRKVSEDGKSSELLIETEVSGGCSGDGECGYCDDDWLFSMDETVRTWTEVRDDELILVRDDGNGVAKKLFGYIMGEIGCHDEGSIRVFVDEYMFGKGEMVVRCVFRTKGGLDGKGEFVFESHCDKCSGGVLMAILTPVCVNVERMGQREVGE